MPNPIPRETQVCIAAVLSRGNSVLAKMFSLIYLGDFVSLYSAYLNGVDPTTIAGIDRLKGALSEL